MIPHLTLFGKKEIFPLPSCPIVPQRDLWYACFNNGPEAPMKRSAYWILLTLGILPFALPILLGLYRMTIETWTLGDWLILYSFLYWPTYLLGAALLTLAIINLRK